MTHRLQNFFMVALFALMSLFWAQTSTTSSSFFENSTLGGYQLFETSDSGVIADNPLNVLEKIFASPETAPECCNAPKGGVDVPTTTAQTQNLRTNMQRDGMQFDAGEEAHHIVAKGDSRAERSRELLAEAGVDVNSPANGVPLPGTNSTPNPNNKAVHRGDVIHSDGYYRYVERELLEAPVNQRPQVIRRIADELERGEINWTD